MGPPKNSEEQGLSSVELFLSLQNQRQIGFCHCFLSEAACGGKKKTMGMLTVAGDPL